MIINLCIELERNAFLFDGFPSFCKSLFFCHNICTKSFLLDQCVFQFDVLSVIFLLKMFVCKNNISIFFPCPLFIHVDFFFKWVSRAVGGGQGGEERSPPQFFGKFTYFPTNSTPKTFKFGSFIVLRPPSFCVAPPVLSKLQRPWILNGALNLILYELSMKCLRRYNIKGRWNLLKTGGATQKLGGKVL